MGLKTDVYEVELSCLGGNVGLEGVSLCPVYAKRAVEVLRCTGRGLWSRVGSLLGNCLRLVELCLAGFA